MKILLYYPYKPVGLGPYLHNALCRLGHEVTWVGESDTWGHPGYLPNVDLLTLLGDEVKHYDLAIAIDDHWLPNVTRGWERFPFPTVLISFDYQHDPRWFDPLLPLFDHIVLLNLDPVTRVSQRHPSVHWIPAAIDPEALSQMEVERVYDIGIVGSINPSYPRRSQRLTELAKRYRTNDMTRFYPPQEIADIYNRSKIVVNLMPDGIKTLSFRTFEGMACGALMLIEDTDSGLERLFKKGEHLVVFRNDEEMYSKIDYYLAHIDERERIACAGQQLVRSQHTWTNRMMQLLGIVESAGKNYTAPARSMTPVNVQRLYAEAYKYRSKIDSMFDLFGDGNPPLWVWPLVARALIRRAGIARWLRQVVIQR